MWPAIGTVRPIATMVWTKLRRDIRPAFTCCMSSCSSRSSIFTPRSDVVCVANSNRPGGSRQCAPAGLTDVVDRLGPVVLEQARERPVREQLPPGLAARAVVARVLGVDDPLDRRPADRAG